MSIRKKRSVSKPAARPRRGRARTSEERADTRVARWTFLSNHAHVLLCLARRPDARLRDVAADIGITERAVQKILADLAAEGLVERRRLGRRNEYELHLEQPLRHPIEASHKVRELVELLLAE